MDPFLKRILSRKFLMAVAAFVGVALTTFGASYANEIADAIVKIGGAFLEVVIVLGYVKAEATIDRERIVAQATTDVYTKPGSKPLKPPRPK